MAEGPSVELGIAGLGPATRIGSGGFADVYRAQQTNLRREVAVKVLRAPANDQQARMRFERECHAVGAVSGHPNIVAVHEGGFTADGRAYLVMEYFPGGSLLDRVVRHGPMSAAETRDIGLKIGRALGVAHDAGVLHRDVKPANILVSAYGEPALADFGIARVEGGQLTATGLVTASFAHAAPEVLEGGSPSAASDIYSLGSTLFELFSGRAPHVRPGDESAWALMRRVVSEVVPDPSGLGMPEPLASTVRRATRRKAADRHPTAGHFVAELEGAGPPAVAGPTEDASPPVGVAAQRPSPQPGSPELSHTVVMATTTEQPSAVRPDAARTQPGAPTVGGLDEPTATYDVEDAAEGPGPQPPRRRGRALLALTVVVAALLGVGAWLSLGGLLTESPGEVAFEFPAGSSGPLDAGVAYDLAVTGGDDGTRLRLVVDGEPIGSPEPQLPPFIAEAGRHSVAVEAITDDDVQRTELVEVYVIGDLPEPGFRANLLSVTAAPANWSTAIARFDELVVDGHTDLQLLPSDRFPRLPGGFWNIFVPGFGDSREDAVAYCASFELLVPDECFVTFFDPNA
ncbi:MAG: protein kinase [Acidimicrobiia bacterium]|nr:protein kinase [Acidimicrobiia bacterium]